KVAGFRVYLERGWWSSGEGELLGVVLFDGAGTAQDGVHTPYVTMWGLDTAWAANNAVGFGPLPSELPLGVRTGSGSLVSSGLPVTVVGHSVAFDPVRNLWYCDIDLEGRIK